MVIKINPEKAIIGIGVLLVAALIWVCVLWRSAESEKAAAVNVSDAVLKTWKKEKEAEKAHFRSDSLKYEHNIDSASRVIEALETARKNDFYYYQNKLNALKKVNTYDRRMRYLDSLERAIGSRP